LKSEFNIAASTMQWSDRLARGAARGGRPRNATCTGPGGGLRTSAERVNTTLGRHDNKPLDQRHGALAFD